MLVERSLISIRHQSTDVAGRGIKRHANMTGPDGILMHAINLRHSLECGRDISEHILVSSDGFHHSVFLPADDAIPYNDIIFHLWKGVRDDASRPWHSRLEHSCTRPPSTEITAWCSS